MLYRGIITGTALTKNTPLDVLSLNQSDNQTDFLGEEESKDN